MGRRGKRRKQLPDGLKEKRGYWQLKEEALYHALWRLSSRRICGRVVKQTNNNFRKFISVIKQLDTQNVCFTISLFHASTCFEHMCSSSRGQNCITQPLVSSYI